MGRKRSIVVAALAVGALVLVVGASPAAPPRDYAGQALNVLAPGESGGLGLDDNSADQMALYDGLTPLFESVREPDLPKYFKSARFGLGGERPARIERTGRPGVRIERDRYGVAHVTGMTRADVMFGAGWATAADRSFLLELIRWPGRLAALDVPGIDAFAVVGSLLRFEPSAATEDFLRAQEALLLARGPKGTQVLGDIDAYVVGINAYYRSTGSAAPPWTRIDVIGAAALIGGVFGKGGGDEVAASELLPALQQRLGAAKGRAVWDDLRQLEDPEAPVSVDGSFPYAKAPKRAPGSVVVDDGSFEPAAVTTVPAAPAPPARMSNALLVSAGRSSSGHPLFVAGPQVGFYYPGLLMELDLHGGGVHARGAAFPGISLYVLIGRGPDFAWSATSSGADVVDEYVEMLCGDDTHYLYRGECVEMGTFDAGVLKGRGGEPDEQIVFRTTVHGPVTGYATVSGQRVAITEKRSTRGREVLTALAFSDLNSGRVTSARSFLKAMSQVEMTFNWLYADDRDIAMFSSGRLPLRAPGVDPGLPTRGMGEYEWLGFLPPAGHVQGINPAAGAIVNWNNKPGRGFAAADDEWSYGSVHRVDLLARAIGARRTHSLATVVAAMNKAATQDLRAVEVLPVIVAVLETGPAPSARAARMLSLLRVWRAKGASRLDRDLNGKIDDPGAAIMDAVWPELADAVMRPVLGPLVERLDGLEPRDVNANAGGAAYVRGWYGYVDKDLRALLGRPVEGAFRTRFCGSGSLKACRAALWRALEAAGRRLAAAQGPDPAAWRADARTERIAFIPGLLKRTMRWANRPTFQQAVTFTGHRPR